MIQSFFQASKSWTSKQMSVNISVQSLNLYSTFPLNRWTITLMFQKDGEFTGMNWSYFFFCPICFIQCKQRKCWNISFYFLFFLSGLKMGAINKSDKNRSTYRLTFENVNVSDFNDYKQQSKNLKQTIFC